MPKGDRGAGIHSVASGAGFWIYAVVRGTLDERFREYPSARCWLSLVALAGSAKCFHTNTRRLCRSFREDVSVVTERHVVERLPVAPEQVRAWLPVETYPISAGVKGGLAGSVAMAVLACLYGLLKTGSIWYPINLLAAVVYARRRCLGIAIEFLSRRPLLPCGGLTSRHLHPCGLLYGAMLPMFARRPILLGGVMPRFCGPDCCTPSWTFSIRCLGVTLIGSWFMASQFAFGIVAGLVVVRQARVSTRRKHSLRHARRN